MEALTSPLTPTVLGSLHVWKDSNDPQVLSRIRADVDAFGNQQRFEMLACRLNTPVADMVWALGVISLQTFGGVLPCWWPAARR